MNTGDLQVAPKVTYTVHGTRDALKPFDGPSPAIQTPPKPDKERVGFHVEPSVGSGSDPRHVASTVAPLPEAVLLFLFLKQ